MYRISAPAADENSTATAATSRLATVGAAVAICVKTPVTLVQLRRRRGSAPSVDGLRREYCPASSAKDRYQSTSAPGSRLCENSVCAAQGAFALHFWRP